MDGRADKRVGRPINGLVDGIRLLGGTTKGLMLGREGNGEHMPTSRLFRFGRHACREAAGRRLVKGVRVVCGT